MPLSTSTVQNWKGQMVTEPEDFEPEDFEAIILVWHIFTNFGETCIRGLDEAKSYVMGCVDAGDAQRVSQLFDKIAAKDYDETDPDCNPEENEEVGTDGQVSFMLDWMTVAEYESVVGMD